jgi:YihY family inner membrane protein
MAPAVRPSWTEHPRIVPLRRRWHAVDLLLTALDGFRRHRTGQNAALVTHYGFLSVFPLVVVLTTVLGLVLRNRPDLQADIVDSALNQIPIVGPTLGDDPSKLSGSVVILLFGLVAALWAGMKAFVGLQSALDDIAEIPLDRRSNLAVVRLHALIGIGVVGIAQVGTAVMTSLVGAAPIPGVSKALLLVAAAATNALVLALCYRWLCSRRQPWRAVMPGAVVVGVIFAGLQLVGTAVVGRAIANASPVYGTFATVIGLMTWLSVHAFVALLGAELNAALHSRETRSVAITA